MKLIINLILVLSLSTQVFATNFNAGVGFAKPSEFVFQNYKNQELISLRLLGAVRKAGIYHVPKNINLQTLLSLAGGTSKDANIEEIIIGSARKKKSVTLNLNKLIIADYKKPYNFNTNDTVFVKRNRPFISDQSIKIVTVISLLLTAALSAVIINEKIKNK